MLTTLRRSPCGNYVDVVPCRKTQTLRAKLLQRGGNDARAVRHEQQLIGRDSRPDQVNPQPGIARSRPRNTIRRGPDQERLFTNREIKKKVGEKERRPAGRWVKIPDQVFARSD
ncbi:unnamed protein product [Linum trigynum]|uniref:Uncharacterized protein n=1 Tax=Linum trigynum TaxID=586398 RepID=A0AAV2CJQ5_9ROSI